MKIKTLEKISDITMEICISVVITFTILGEMGLPLPVCVSVGAAATATLTIVEAVTWKKMKEYYSQENK